MVSPLPSFCLLGTAALLCAGVAVWDGDILPAVGAPLQANAAIADSTTSVEAESVSPDKKVRIAKASDGLFYVYARVNGMPVRFLVDTGANLVVLTAADARRVGALGGVVNPIDTIATAGGTSRMGRVTLERVSVAGRELAGVDAAVMHGGLSVSLMGQNMLSKLGPIMLTADEMSFPKDR
jgi:aspartyl protease family protein